MTKTHTNYTEPEVLLWLTIQNTMKPERLYPAFWSRTFIGPVTKDECLAEVPVQYYIMGKLYPQKDTVEALDLARNPLLENEIETYDASISLSNPE